MKFLNGMWEIKKGVKLNRVRHVFEIHNNGNSLTIIAPTVLVKQNADTLNIALLTINISSPLEDVIKLKATHHDGKLDKGPHFEIYEKTNVKVSIEETEEYVKFTSGKTSVLIKKGDAWSMTYSYDGKYLTSSEEHGLAYIIDENGNSHIREMLNIAPTECIYGLGERFTAYVKNGQTVNMWNEDGGTCTEIAYKNVPFFISNRKYGVLVNDSGPVSYEIGTEVVSKTQFSIQDESLEYYFIASKSMKGVIENYTTLTGKPALPPAWSFGLWLSTSFTTDYDEKVVNSFIDGMIDRNIPLNVFHFDCFWMKPFRWCNMEFDDKNFKDPVSFLSNIKSKGIKICVWINPYVGQLSSMFEEGKKNGYFIKKTNGDVWQWDMWQAGMAVVDFTNPEACKWYASKLEKLVDMGVDTFKTDFGERIPWEDVVYYGGEDPLKMHNYYTHLYNQCVFGVLEKKFGKDKALVFARSGTAGGQKFPVHWGGDSTATYESMAETLRGGLSLAMSGYSFWSHDISGFETTATPDLYKRWVAFGLLSSHSRLHGSKSYRVPWNFDEESVDVLRKFTNLKCELMPYIYSTSINAHITGIPVLRSMIMEFEDDLSCRYLDLQYMFGDNILVAPVFNDESIANYYLPKGKWTNILNNKLYNCEDTGKWIEEKHDYMSVPILAKENSVIAFGNNNKLCDYEYMDNINYHIYEPLNNIETKIFNSDTSLACEVNVKREANAIKITVTNAPYAWKATLHLNGKIQVLEAKKDQKELVFNI
ncbi:alpha-xylosidase [Brachyspira pilosicoli]|uniref:alpha-xylosidase n=1 Tax=Brachyspira pilosicoli TaxID=52584 RepID=UPI003003EAF2